MESHNSNSLILEKNELNSFITSNENILIIPTNVQFNQQSSGINSVIATDNLNTTNTNINS